MSNFKYGFFDELIKIAVSAEDLNSASKRIENRVNAVPFKSLKFPPQLDVGTPPVPAALPRQIPLDYIEDPAIKEDLTRKNAPYVTTKTPLEFTHPYVEELKKELPKSLLSENFDALKSQINHHEARELLEAARAKQVVPFELDAYKDVPGFGTNKTVTRDQLLKLRKNLKNLQGIAKPNFGGQGHTSINIPIEDLNISRASGPSQATLKSIKENPERSERLRQLDMGLTKVKEWQAKNAKDPKTRQAAQDWLDSTKADAEAIKPTPLRIIEYKRIPELVNLVNASPKLRGLKDVIFGSDKIRRPIRKLIHEERGALPARESSRVGYQPISDAESLLDFKNKRKQYIQSGLLRESDVPDLQEYKYPTSDKRFGNSDAVFEENLKDQQESRYDPTPRGQKRGPNLAKLKNADSLFDAIHQQDPKFLPRLINLSRKVKFDKSLPQYQTKDKSLPDTKRYQTIKSFNDAVYNLKRLAATTSGATGFPDSFLETTSPETKGHIGDVTHLSNRVKRLVQNLINQKELGILTNDDINRAILHIAKARKSRPTSSVRRAKSHISKIISELNKGTERLSKNNPNPSSGRRSRRSLLDGILKIYNESKDASPDIMRENFKNRMKWWTKHEKAVAGRVLEKWLKSNKDVKPRQNRSLFGDK